MQRRAGVDRDRVAQRGPAGAGHQLAGLRDVLRRRAADDRSPVVAADAQRFRRQAQLLRSARLVDQHRARGADHGDLVAAVIAVHGHHPPYAQQPGRLRDHPAERPVVDADDLPDGAGRIGQRPEQVHHRLDAELLPHRRGVAHGAVVGRSEQKGEPGPGQQLGGGRRVEVGADAQRGVEVGAAALAGEGAVAVLGDAGAGSAGDQRGHRRDVEAAGAGPAGAARVQEIARRRQRRLLAPQDRRAAGDLGRGVSLGVQRHQEAGDLRGVEVAVGQLLHELGGLLLRQVGAGRHPVQQPRHVERFAFVVEKVRQQSPPMIGSDRFRVKLHALHDAPFMPDAHDLAVRRPGGDGEPVRHRLRVEHQRMVAGEDRRRRYAAKHAAPVGGYRVGLAVHDRLRLDDTPSEGGADRLMAQADAQDRDLAGEPPDRRQAHAGLLRAARAGRDDDPRRPQRGDPVDVDPVVAVHADLLIGELRQVLEQVVGKRVVVVDQHVHQSVTPSALTSARSFSSVSSNSRSGDESYTTPAPACSTIVPSFLRPQRMAMQVSREPSGST